MAGSFDSGEARLLSVLQRGIPIVPEPFAAVGGKLGLSARKVVAAVESLRERGMVRRFGAVFDSRSLGYASTLCAVDVPADRLEDIAAVLQPHPGITHSYERERHPNLWFTMTAPADELDTELERLGRQIAPLRILNLPALRRFKIDVVFDLSRGDDGPPVPRNTPRPAAHAAPATLSEKEQGVVRRMQGSIPVTERPFDALAVEHGYDVDALLELLRTWQTAGIIRRIGIVARHRNLGFKANAMCVWDVAEETVESAGLRLAGCPEVTHCYQRPRLPEVPYNLYAMIHADASETARGMLERISTAAGLPVGRMKVSLREFKKSSPRFFCEASPAAVGRAGGLEGGDPA
jgi:siroheme decarboxylase